MDWRESMKNSIALLECCHVKQVNPFVVTQPQRFKEGKDCADRARILKSLHLDRKLSTKDIAKLCPLSVQQIRAIFRNGI